MTPAQLATLKAALIADPTANAFRQAGDTAGLGFWINAATSTVVWRSSTPIDEVYNSIVWASLTPLDAPDSTALFTNRALSCQAKQINLQMLLQGQQSVASGKALIRGGLQDALQNLPSGAGGANLGAGWATVKTAMQRFANRAEALFAVGTGTAATPSDLVFEGTASISDLAQLVN